MMILQYLERHGSVCIIDSSVSAYVSLKHSTKGTNEYMREHAYEGWISKKEAESGKSFTIQSGDHYLVFTSEAERDAYFLTCRKANSEINILERSETTNEYGTVTVTWTPKLQNSKVYGEVVTSALRQTDPGLLPTTLRVYYVPSTAVVEILSRLVHEMTQTEAEAMGCVYDSTYKGARFKVDSIDPLMLPGIKRLQVSKDERDE